MPSLAIIGAQWGDEGKGKITDYLDEEADLISGGTKAKERSQTTSTRRRTSSSASRVGTTPDTRSSWTARRSSSTGSPPAS